MNFSKIKYFMEHSSKAVYGLEKVIEKLGIVHFIHTVRMNKAHRQWMEGGGVDNEFANFYKAHRSEFREVYELLEDDFSKKTYKAVIEYRKTYDIRTINKVYVQPQYFLKNILPPAKKGEVFVDGGAYIGDTGMAFLKQYNGNAAYKMYLWECDEKNIARIHKNLKGANYEIIPYAMWEKEAELRFSEQGETVSKVSESGNRIVKANSIDEVHRNQKVTFLKMDIEGSEINALKGAEQTIKKQKPKLAICIYHADSHLYEIPLLIKKMVPEYKIYIRHHSDLKSETVVYASI